MHAQVFNCEMEAEKVEAQFSLQESKIRRMHHSLLLHANTFAYKPDAFNGQGML